MRRTPLVLLTAALLAPLSAFAEEAPADAAARPGANAIGIGIGYVASGPGGGFDITKPNISSVRIVLSEKLTLEPMVTLSYAAKKTSMGTAMGEIESDEPTTAIGAGAAARLTLASRGPVDFVGLASVKLMHSGTTTGKDTTKVERTGQEWTMNWGFGFSWFVRSNFALSFDAYNPFISWSRAKTDPAGDNNDMVTSNFLFGLIFNPTVQLMAHLLF